MGGEVYRWKPKGTRRMCQDGLKRGRSEMDKPPISEPKKVWAQEHALIQPTPFRLPAEKQA